MMTTHLISLVSEHLLPNYLLIKEMENKWDKLVFITTEKMGALSMTSRFCAALKTEKKDVKMVVVSDDDLPDVLKKLRDSGFSEDDKYIVNLTGGTKIMSIGTFTHFLSYKENAAFYYIPIGENKIENVLTGENLPLHYRVNVEEYLSLYGLTFTYENTARMQDNKGAEFEAYITNRIRTEKALKQNFIHRGVKIFRGNEKMNDNEIDVAWTHENELYIGECKVSLTPPDGKETRKNPVEYLDDIMYKLSAISKDFGLRVNPYIFIRSYLPGKIFSENRMAAIHKRLKILGIKGLLTGKEIGQKNLEI